MAKTKEVGKLGPFETTKFTAVQLQNELWDVLRNLRERKIRASDANAVTQVAKEICNIAKVELQHKLLDQMMQGSRKPSKLPLISHDSDR